MQGQEVLGYFWDECHAKVGGRRDMAMLTVVILRFDEVMLL